MGWGRTIFAWWRRSSKEEKEEDEEESEIILFSRKCHQGRIFGNNPSLLFDEHSQLIENGCIFKTQKGQSRSIVIVSSKYHRKVDLVLHTWPWNLYVHSHLWSSLHQVSDLQFFRTYAIEHWTVLTMPLAPISLQSEYEIQSRYVWPRSFVSFINDGSTGDESRSVPQGAVRIQLNLRW